MHTEHAISESKPACVMRPRTQHLGPSHSTYHRTMPAATTCLTDAGELISIDEALELRSTKSRINFRCTECSQPVRPHKAGGDTAAHFEHRSRNPGCTLSHKLR